MGDGRGRDISHRCLLLVHWLAASRCSLAAQFASADFFQAVKEKWIDWIIARRWQRSVQCNTTIQTRMVDQTRRHRNQIGISFLLSPNSFWTILFYYLYISECAVSWMSKTGWLCVVLRKIENTSSKEERCGGSVCKCQQWFKFETFQALWRGHEVIVKMSALQIVEHDLFVWSKHTSAQHIWDAGQQKYKNSWSFNKIHTEPSVTWILCINVL